MELKQLKHMLAIHSCRLSETIMWDKHETKYKLIDNKIEGKKRQNDGVKYKICNEKKTKNNILWYTGIPEAQEKRKGRE